MQNKPTRRRDTARASPRPTFSSESMKIDVFRVEASNSSNDSTLCTALRMLRYIVNLSSKRGKLMYFALRRKTAVVTVLCVRRNGSCEVFSVKDTILHLACRAEAACPTACIRQAISQFILCVKVGYYYKLSHTLTCFYGLVGV